MVEILIGVGKSEKQELVKWKLENNTTRIGQNLKGVGKKKTTTGIVKWELNGNGRKRNKKKKS